MQKPNTLWHQLLLTTFVGTASFKINALILLPIVELFYLEREILTHLGFVLTFGTCERTSSWKYERREKSCHIICISVWEKEETAQSMKRCIHITGNLFTNAGTKHRDMVVDKVNGITR